MAPFRFRLATLLRLRIADRDERRAQLADAQRAAEIVQGRINEIDLELRSLRLMNQRAMQPGKIDVDQFLDRQRYEFQAQAERAATVEQLQKIQAEVERRREIAVAADREVRILEKLRDNQADQHRQEEEKLSQKQFDELANRLSFYGEQV
jgi:flagellar protein FliJ